MKIPKILTNALTAGLAWSSASADLNWTWRHPLPQGNTLNAAVSTGSQIVAVGVNGSVITSPDGSTWTSRQRRDDDEMLAIAWTGTRYIAVGGNYSAVAYTSTDGVSWTGLENQFLLSSGRLNAVIWTGTQAVAVGGGLIFTSPDGLTWTRRTTPISQSLKSVVWTGSLLVAVGSGGAILTSPDGVTWTKRGSGTSYEMETVVWTGKGLVAAGRDYFSLTSPDGITWTEHQADIPFKILSMTWTGTELVAVGSIGWTYRSADGITWTEEQLPSSWDINAVIKAGNRLLAFGVNGTIRSSTDGIQWTFVSRGTESDLYGVAWSGKTLVVVGQDGTILTSKDGVAWTEKQTDEFFHWRAVAWNGAYFTAVGTDGTISTSPDGETWTPRVSGVVNDLFGIAWTGTKLVAVGWEGTIITSSDGIAWSKQVSGTQTHLEGVAWSGGTLVAMGHDYRDPDAALLLTSPDGATWTLRKNAALPDFNYLTSGENRFLAISYGELAGSSPDGVNWTVDTTFANLSSAVWTGKQWVPAPGATHTGGAFGAAPWLYSHSVGDMDFLSMAWTGELAVAVGESGAILTAPLEGLPIRRGVAARTSIGLRFLPHRLIVTSPPEGWSAGAKAELLTPQGISIRGPESINAREIIFSTDGLAPGMYLFRSKSAGRPWIKSLVIGR